MTTYIIPRFNIMNQIQDTINAIVKHCIYFKIGKTGQPLEERFDNKYQQEYTHITSLFETTSKHMASYMESYLIDACMEHHKCKNEKDGEASFNDEIADSMKYIVYIVWKE